MSSWTLVYDSYEPARERVREALCTLGNSYVCVRGAWEELPAGDEHYPGTYLAGGYNRLPTEIAGRIVENEDLVNWSNWLALSFCPGGGSWLGTAGGELLTYMQALHLREGLLERRIRVREPDGRITALHARRIVHMAEPHLGAIEWTLTPENWSGSVRIRSALDGTVANAGVARYAELNSRHLEAISGRTLDGGIQLHVRSSQSRIEMAQAARTRAFIGDAEIRAPREHVQRAGYVAEELELQARQGEAVRVEKVVALYTSRDHAISEAGLAARAAISEAGSFTDLLRTHAMAWSHLWKRCDIRIEGAPREQLILRLHLFHLLQTAPQQSIDLDTGVPARGWHGEAYRGHIFWDELFIFPLLNLRMPEVTRSLLMYRYRRLGEARKHARAAGFRGALFPWQSGSTGREETQVVHLNPRSGRWLPDNSHRQYHVNSAIAFNVWQYYQSTGDTEFLSFHGAEIILEIARLWASVAVLDESSGRFDIRGVMGPDEYHEAYPGTEEGGLDNNAYTNVMASWVLNCARIVLERLDTDRRTELRELLDLEDEELAHWDHVSRRLRVCFHEDGIVSQFEGYDALQELDWAAYRERYGDIQRLDRILEAEDDTTNRYKLSKQADVLMLCYLFSQEELESLFARLGYTLTAEVVERTIVYYLDRTSHGSTLSRVVHAWVLAQYDGDRSWELFDAALQSDIDDIQGGTTGEGIHLGAMAGTVDIVQRCFLGIAVHDELLWLAPRLPRQLPGIHVVLRYRGQWLDVHATHERLSLTLRRGPQRTSRLGVCGEVREIAEGETLTLRLPERTRGA